MQLQQFKLHEAKPSAIFLLPCNFFPNRTLVHAISYTYYTFYCCYNSCNFQRSNINCGLISCKIDHEVYEYMQPTRLVFILYVEYKVSGRITHRRDISIGNRFKILEKKKKKKKKENDLGYDM